jgi:hypothetical protein
MTQPVDVPLLDASFGFAYPLLLAGAALLKGVVVGAVVVFLLVKLLGRKVAARWPIALATGAVLILAVAAWSWLTSADFSAVTVRAGEIELRYATWPRRGWRIPFDRIESVSMSASGRRALSYHLVVTTKSTGGLERTHWASAAGSEEHVTLALKWIAHASGGRVVVHQPRAPAAR